MSSNYNQYASDAVNDFLKLIPNKGELDEESFEYILEQLKMINEFLPGDILYGFLGKFPIKVGGLQVKFFAVIVDINTGPLEQRGLEFVCPDIIAGEKNNIQREKELMFVDGCVNSLKSINHFNRCVELYMDWYNILNQRIPDEGLHDILDI